MGSHQDLILSGVIYKKEIVDYLMSTNREWEDLSWRTREHICRRLHICILLCNTTLLNPKSKAVITIEDSGHE